MRTVRVRTRALPGFACCTPYPSRRTAAAGAMLVLLAVAEGGHACCCHWLRFCRLPACSLSHPARQQSTAPDGCHLTLMSFSAPPACLPAAPGCRRTLSVGAAGVTCLLRGAASSMRPNRRRSGQYHHATESLQCTERWALHKLPSRANPVLLRSPRAAF